MRTKEDALKQKNRKKQDGSMRPNPAPPSNKGRV